MRGPREFDIKSDKVLSITDSDMITVLSKKSESSGQVNVFKTFQSIIIGDNTISELVKATPASPIEPDIWYSIL